MPLKPQPVNIIHDRLRKILAFLQRIGIIKAQIGGAAKFGCNTKVQADGLGMANMQMAIGFWWKSGNNFIVLAGLQVAYNNIAYKIANRWILIVIQLDKPFYCSVVTSGEDSGFYRIKLSCHYS